MLVDVGTDAKDMHIIPYLGFVSAEYLHIRDADIMPEMISSAVAAASSLISPSIKNASTSSPNHLPENSNLHELTLMHSSFLRKVRRGNSEPDETGFDGGYVILVSPNEHNRSYDLILSAGVADDVSFEEEMASLYNAPVHLYSKLLLKFTCPKILLSECKNNVGCSRDLLTRMFCCMPMVITAGMSRG